MQLLPHTGLAAVPQSAPAGQDCRPPTASACADRLIREDIGDQGRRLRGPGRSWTAGQSPGKAASNGTPRKKGRLRRDEFFLPTWEGAQPHARSQHGRPSFSSPPGGACTWLPPPFTRKGNAHDVAPKPGLPKNAIIRLNSFGYLHLSAGPDGSPVPPAADRIEDVRDRLRDPGAARDILDLDRLHLRVQDVALGTPGARRLLADLADRADLPADPSHIAIGCAGGRAAPGR
ncbi:hypothetical protein [Streptomyces virginiae]|uniref:hypothetical protein n=1 Tax=Streptomyces virginiae TaxID=1961 RepID=UPI00364CF6BE